ncbi:DUF2474 family protein [Massilia sp. GCM10023247]|uniref:DUF2474 family protein n=1 Tax=Massilia sp. GCM10023247 TaxID=3252643 RepID=UPI0036205DF7
MGEGPQPGAQPERPAGRRALWLRRLGWMAALWAAGVAALWLVATLIRAIMHATGMR